VLTLTEAASRKLANVLAEQSEHGQSYIGVRLSAMSGCCSGPQYGMSLAERSQEGDWVGESGGIKVLVDPESAPLLSGIHIDYVETPQGSGFTIGNPDALSAKQSSGGCGGGGCTCGGH
jgi:iron-sulfur cluster assembly accessory protein